MTSERVGKQDEPQGPLKCQWQAYGQSYKGTVHFEEYGSGELALALFDADGVPLGPATVELVSQYGQAADPQRFVSKSEEDIGVWLYDRNAPGKEGMCDALVEVGVVSLTGKTFEYGNFGQQAVHAVLTKSAVGVLLQVFRRRAGRTYMKRMTGPVNEDVGFDAPASELDMSKMLRR